VGCGAGTNGAAGRRPSRRPRHRGAGRGPAPAGARPDRDDSGDRASHRDRISRVLEGAQRRGNRERESRERRDPRRRRQVTTGIAALASELVQQAPDLDPQTIETLRRALESVDLPLARSIARILELVAIDVVDPAIALPALAEACATL